MVYTLGMTNTETATITTARAATAAVKRALRDAGLPLTRVESSNGASDEPASSLVYDYSPELEAALAAIPGQTRIKVYSSAMMISVRF